MSLLYELLSVGNELKSKYNGKFDQYLSETGKDFGNVIYNESEFKQFEAWYELNK